jgi:hypothetical protein
MYPEGGVAMAIDEAFAAAQAALGNPDDLVRAQSQGETTNYELAYLLHEETGHNFQFHATAEQFVAFQGAGDDLAVRVAAHVQQIEPAVV